jgi:GTP-binding protein HflX
VHEQIASVYEVLEELGIQETDTILVLNQIDRVHEPGALEQLKQRYPSAIPISARSGDGLSRLASAVSDALTQHCLDVDVDLDGANGRLLAYLAKHGEILSRTYAEDRVSVHCRMPRKYLAPIHADEARIRIRATGQDLERNGNGHAVSGEAHRNGQSISEVA